MSNSKRLQSFVTMVGLVFLSTSIGCEGPTRSSGKLPAEQPAGPTPNQSAATGDMAKPDSEPPPEATIKAKLEKDMWGPPAQGGTIHTYHYQSLKIAPARVGDPWTDGVPANLRTNIHTVKVVVDVTRTFTDGSTKQESKDQTYGFFKDAFGDWNYRFVQNN